MFESISEIMTAHKAWGGHFFDPDTMRFFRSKVYEGVYGGRYFVTSERDDGMYFDGKHYAAWDGQRRYTLRETSPTGVIHTVGEHGQYATLAAAEAAAKKLAARVVEAPEDFTEQEEEE